MICWSTSRSCWQVSSWSCPWHTICVTVVPVAVAGALVAVLAILVTRGGSPGWRRLATMTVGAAAIVSFALLDELDKTLTSLTMPGNPRRGFSGLVPSFNPLAAHDRIAEVGSNWYEFRHGQTITAPSDFTIRWAFVLLDSAVLAIAYPLLLYVLVASYALRLDGDRDEPRLRKSMLTVAQSRDACPRWRSTLRRT